MIGRNSASTQRPNAAHAADGRLRDLAGAAVLTAFFLLASGHNQPPSGGHTLDALGYLLLVLAGAAVALCRRFPRTALILVVAALGCYLGRGYPVGPIYLAGMLVLFSLGWHTPRRTAASGTGLLVAVLTVVSLTTRLGATGLPLIFAGWAAAAVFLGEVARNRRVYLEGVRQQTRSLELTRVEQARRRIAEDRLRIARDLHDSVGHAMAMINVQAAAGAHVADQRPEAAKQALMAIQQASGDVLDELTAMLGVLRADGESAERMPTPGIAQIRALVESSGSPRLRTGVVLEGRTQDVSEAVGIAAYRIVQESLTNVIRHAGASFVQVTVRAENDRSLHVEVCDDGAGAASTPASSGSGIGIRGMRERAESTGGRLDAGPGPRGGFVVRAEWGPRP
jgi:signal transduction histidine kinase